MSNTDAKTCFVICPIDDEGTAVRKRSDQLLKHVITPPLEACGYTVIRPDKIAKPGIITSDIFNHLLNDDLVVADLTDHNPNVFYELAVRHATKKPVIQLIYAGEKIPFDIAHTRTIFYRIDDLDVVEDTKQKITDQIEAIELNPTDFDNPLSTSIVFQQARESGDPTTQSYVEIIAMLQELRQDVNNLARTPRPRIAGEIVTSSRISDNLKSPQNQIVQLLKDQRDLASAIKAKERIINDDKVNTFAKEKAKQDLAYLRASFHLMDDQLSEIIRTSVEEDSNL